MAFKRLHFAVWQRLEFLFYNLISRRPLNKFIEKYVIISELYKNNQLNLIDPVCIQKYNAQFEVKKLALIPAEN